VDSSLAVLNFLQVQSTSSIVLRAAGSGFFYASHD